MNKDNKKQPSLEQIQKVFAKFQEQQKDGLSPIDKALWELGVTIPQEWKNKKDKQ